MNMELIVWLFPVIFMLHDFEEIIFVKVWRERYQQERSLSKMKKKPFDHFQSTASFSIGVEIIFIILSAVSLFSVILNSFFIWYGLLFAIISHFVIAHIRMTVQFRHYTPGVFTSVIFLPVTIYLLYMATKLLNYDLIEIIFSCLSGIFILVIVFYTLINLEGILDRGLTQYSKRK